MPIQSRVAALETALAIVPFPATQIRRDAEQQLMGALDLAEFAIAFRIQSLAHEWQKMNPARLQQ